MNWVGELTDDAGRVVDSHTLRTRCITLLVKGGTSVKVAQELARHSNPKLTMNVYSKLGVHDLAGALDTLPSLTADARVRMRTTGTDHVRAEAPRDPRPNPRWLERGPAPRAATACVIASATTQSSNASNLLSVTEKREPTQQREGDRLRTLVARETGTHFAFASLRRIQPRGSARSGELNRDGPLRCRERNDPQVFPVRHGRRANECGRSGELNDHGLFRTRSASVHEGSTTSLSRRRGTSLNERPADGG
jgi:hypothetical protein